MNKSITSLIFSQFLVVVFIAIALIGYLWINREYQRFEKDSAIFRANYLDTQRAIIKNEALNAIKFIEFKRLQTEARLQKNLKARVYEGYQIAENIYAENVGIRPPHEIKKMIKDALRPIRFNQGRGYYFIVTLDGVEELYPVAPHFEGKNLLELQDSRGNYVVQEEISVIRRQKEGFVRGFWRKPNGCEEMSCPKMTFVKYFPHFNWYLGTGEYLDHFEKDVQQEVLERLANIRFGKDGYIFVNTYDGKALIMDGDILSPPRNIWDLRDSNGMTVVQEERKAVQNPEGGYISYRWNRPGKEEALPKMSFIKGVPEWKWIIGAGVYVDDVELELAEKRASLQKKIQSDIIVIIMTLCSLVLIISLFVRYIAMKTKTNFTVFAKFFQQAATEATYIERGRLFFAEFVALADLANHMIWHRKLAEEELQLEKAYFEELFDNSPESIVLLDHQGKILRVNAEFTTLFGYTEDEVLEKELDDFITTEPMRAQACELTERARSGEKIFVETKRKRKGGELIDVSVLGVPIKGANQHVVYAIYREITEQKQTEKKLKQLAITDPLTHIYNRLKFDMALEEEMLLCQRYQNNFSIIMFDIDLFKRINDTYGHQVGDYVLREIVRLIQNIIRKSDLFARWGGEEFMVLVRNASKEQAVGLAERIRENVASYSFEKAGTVTCSFGVTQFLPSDDFEEITNRVDQALYKAKALGRNRVVSR